MEIVVLVKQVPDTESLIEIEGDGVSIKKQDIKEEGADDEKFSDGKIKGL